MKIKLKHIAFVYFLIVFAPIYPVLLRSCFYPLKVDPELIKKYNTQKNPFSVQNDNTEWFGIRPLNFSNCENQK